MRWCLAVAVFAVLGPCDNPPWEEQPFVVDEPSDTVCHLVTEGDWWCPPGVEQREAELENPPLGGFLCVDSTVPDDSFCFET